MKFLNVCKATKETLFKGVLSSTKKEANSQGRREGITNMHQLSKKKWRKNLGNSLYHVQLSLQYIIDVEKKLRELGEILLKKKRKRRVRFFIYSNKKAAIFFFKEEHTKKKLIILPKPNLLLPLLLVLNAHSQFLACCDFEDLSMNTHCFTISIVTILQNNF